MRAAHRPFLGVGSDVEAKATIFDENETNKWSHVVYGDAWATVVVRGVVRRERNGRFFVRFEDGDERFMDADDLELAGDTLRRAEDAAGAGDMAEDPEPEGSIEEAAGSGGGAADGGSGSLDDDDAPLMALARAAGGRGPVPVQQPTESSPAATQGSDTASEEQETHATPTRGRGRGTTARRIPGGGRGRGLGAVAGGGGGGITSARIPSTLNLDEVEFHVSGDTSESSDDGEQAASEAQTIVTSGGVTWQKGQGRTVDPFAKDGYKAPAVLKLHRYMDESELAYLLACFPSSLVNQIASLMTKRGRDVLGFGAAWEVTPGEVYLFLGYNIAILILHTEGPKAHLWMKPGDPKYRDALFMAPDLGQFGIDHARFLKLMSAFTLPTYGDASDPFDPVRLFVDAWNAQMQRTLTPGPILVVDESMGLWKGKGMPGLMVVQRKPTPVGRESHTTADADTQCIVFVEPYEGKQRMESKEWVSEWGKAPSVAMRCVKPWIGTARLVIADAGFASLKLAIGLAEHGLYLVGNVKGAHSGYPRAWLLEQVPARGCRVVALTTHTTSSGETWSILAAADRDKQPMCLIGTAGSTIMGETLVRHFTVIRADGSFEVRSATLAQWQIHALYRSHFNAIDKHNSKRQGASSFEDSWKTHRWWLREFQMLFGMSEINAYLLWRKFKPEQEGCSLDLFRRRLAFQLMHNVIRRAELGEGMTLRSLPVGEHVPRPNEVKRSDGKPYKGVCKYCPNRTMWSCCCAPCLEGMDKKQRSGCMYVCSFTQNPRCFALHKDGVEPKQKRSVSAVQGWLARKSRKAARHAPNE